MTQIHQVSAIMPTYDPSERMPAVIRGVMEQGFRSVIVVNDGSRGELSPLFDEAAAIDGCTVIAHEANRGKGAALKTGMAHFLEHCPDGIGVVSIDDDGQHLPEDVRLCAEAMTATGAMVLGVRDFRGPGVPAKSLFGNKVMAMVFRACAGIPISDTQTGLRATPRKHIEKLLAIPGDRFEYETKVLLAAKKAGIEIAEVPIRTVYIEGNKGTHFRAIADSFAIMFQFAKYAVGSLLSAGIDLLGFYLFLHLLSAGNAPDRWSAILLSTLLARTVSASCNFYFNKNIVFGYKGQDTRKAAAKYFALCGVNLLISGQLVALLSRAPFVRTALMVTAMKFLVDTALFVANYVIQKKWVYR